MVFGKVSRTDGTVDGRWNQLLCLAAVCCCLLSPPRSALAADWPMGRANPQGTGSTEEELPQKLELLWEVEVDGIGFAAGPIIADGKVFVNDQDGRVLAIELATGKVLWRIQLDADFVASPAYRDDILYAADQYGKLLALNSQDGSEKWVFATTNGILACPNFHNDALIFTSEDGGLYAVKIEDGKLMWKYDTGVPQLQCAATLAGNRTFLGGCDENFHVVDVSNGKPLIEPIPLGAPVVSTPTVAGNRVIVPTLAGEIVCFHLPDAKEEWRFNDRELSDEFKNSVAVKDGVAVATGRRRVFAIDIETGNVKWAQVMKKRAEASPIIAGSSVIVANADGGILRFDLKTGEQQWSYAVKGSFIGAPAVASGKLVLTNGQGSVFCFGAP